MYLLQYISPSISNILHVHVVYVRTGLHCARFFGAPMLIQFSPQCSRRRHTRRVWELEPAFIIWPRIIAAAFADAAAAEVSSNLKFSARVPSAVQSRLTILALGKIDIHSVLESTNFSPRCFVNPASLPLPLTTSAGFTQPLRDKSARVAMAVRMSVH